MSKNRKVYTKLLGVMLTPEVFDQLECISSQENLSKSEYARKEIESKIDQFIKEQRQAFDDMEMEVFWGILNDLVSYHKKRLNKVKKSKKYICENNHYFISGKEGYIEKFKYTKEFCKEINIIFEVLIEKIQQEIQTNVDCDCQILNALIDKNK